MSLRFYIAAGLLSFSAAAAAPTDLGRNHWSFRSLGDPVPPRLSSDTWSRTPVDSFVLARLRENGLQPSGTISPRKLVRRIYFDLSGLPPSPDEIAVFLHHFEDDPQNAVAALVDELLASPHYGERWARHWLDLARYADSNGSESDQDRPTAYCYRDFLIRSFNEDLSFDTMLRWQIAGDELDPDNPAAIAATGFIVAGTHIILDVPMEEEKVRTRFNELDDMLATTGSAMLGLTLGCARCHDHKYDPIPTRDYYRMLSAFNAGGHTEVALAPQKDVRRHRAEEVQWKRDVDHAKSELAAFLKTLRSEYGRKSFEARIEALDISEREKELLKSDAASPQGKELSKKLAKALNVEESDYRQFVSAEQARAWDDLSNALKSVEARKPKPMPTALAFADFTAEPRDNWLLGRGDFHVKKEPVELGFLSVLTRGKTAAEFYRQAREGRLRDDSTQQRRALAEWMTDLEDGAGSLVARVIVNRVWQHHFGEGLVRTVNDFGVRGQQPTHPELLEWLTREFVRSGWKLKTLHRLIMTSAVYLQVSSYREEGAKIDPENRLLWRQNPRRLEAEILRDSMLAVSGTLNEEMFGPAFKPPIPAEAIQARNVKDPYPMEAKDTPATRRRTVYMFHKRVVQYPLMQVFDGPDAQASCGRRDNTTVAPQALALLNDRFVRTRAEDFARRLALEAGANDEVRARLAWDLAFGREPTPNELASSVHFLQGGRAGSLAPPELALENFCQALFALNEFVYLD